MFENQGDKRSNCLKLLEQNDYNRGLFVSNEGVVPADDYIYFHISLLTYYDRNGVTPSLPFVMPSILRDVYLSLGGQL